MPADVELLTDRELLYRSASYLDDYARFLREHVEDLNFLPPHLYELSERLRLLAVGLKVTIQ